MRKISRRIPRSVRAGIGLVVLGLSFGLGPYIVLQKGAPVFLGPKIEKALFGKGKLVGNRAELEQRIAQFKAAFEGDRVFMVRDDRSSIKESIPIIGPPLAYYLGTLAKATNASFPEGLGRDPIEPMLSRIDYADSITLIEMVETAKDASEESDDIFSGTIMAKCIMGADGKVIRLEMANHFPYLDMTAVPEVQPLIKACEQMFMVPEADMHSGTTSQG